MGHHTYPMERADNLEDASRYRYLSREELLALLAPGSDEVVADLGSGTGFYTDDVAPYVGTLYAVDLQPEMHEYYREKGMPENVEPITANIDDLPLADDELHAAYSIMTYHEFATPAALAEIRRVVRSGGRVVIVDWSATGEGTDGPALEERFDIGTTIEHLQEAGYTIFQAEDRKETFVVVAQPK